MMKSEEMHRLNEVTTPCETTEIKPLGPKGTRGEFFLKLEKRLNFPKYHMHIMVDREGRKVMFYNCKGVAFNEGDCVLVKATISDYRTWKNFQQTYINRVTVLKNVGSVVNNSVHDVHLIHTSLCSWDGGDNMSASSFNTIMGKRNLDEWE